MQRVLLLLLLALPLTAYAAAPLPAAVALIEALPAPDPLVQTHERARVAWEHGDADTAATLVRTYLRGVTPPPAGAPSTGWIWVQACHFGEPSRHLHGAIPADPRAVSRLVDFGHWLLQGGDPQGAIDLLEAVLVRFPDAAEGHLVVAEARSLLGDTADARRHAARYLALVTGPPSS